MVRRFLRRLALYAFQAGFVLPLLKGYAGLRYRRRDTIPHGPCLVVANHNSHLDAAVLMWLFPLRRQPYVHPVAAADYFSSNWLRKTMALVLMNAIPITRKPKHGQDPLQPLATALRDGHSLILFPEGSRGEAGVVAPFRSGVGRLIRAVPGLLVVPVFLSGPERIWPRGKMMPLPLRVDVNVGRPRTYPHQLEPREIAARVRRDVLALAPPPPPVPGPRPSPPLRIAVCGIDAARSQQVLRAVTERIGSIDRTFGLTEPMLEADHDGMRESPGPIPLTRSRTWLSLLANVFRTSGRFKGEKFAELVEQAAVDEALEHGRAARFVIGGGNALVDLLATAEADFYRGVFDESGLKDLMHYLTGERRIPLRRWWRFIRTAPEVWLLNVFDLARLMAPDVLVLLETAPTETMSRLRSDGRALQRFENEQFLAELQQGYRRVAEMLKKRRRTEVLEFADSALEPAEIADRVASSCRRLIDRVAGSAPARG